MSLTVIYRASVYSTTGATSYTASPTWTPASGSLLIALVMGSLASSPNDPTSGVTGHGVTYTKLTLSGNLVGTTHAMSVWVANAGASPSSVAATAAWAATNRTGGVVIEFEVTGWGGADAVNAIVQNPTSNNGGAASTGFSFSMAAAQKASNRALSYWVHLANEGTTPRANWTETAGADGNFNNPATGAEGQFRSDAFETTASAAWTTSSVGRGVALEIRAQDTATRTQTGIANIRATTSRTQTGKGAIRNTTIKTQSGVSRVSARTTREQTGLSRITGRATRTQTGITRITATAPLKTQTGLSRITATATRTQTGVANITASAAVQKNQTGKTRIQKSVQSTQIGTSQIRATTTKAQSGRARIQASIVKEQTGRSRIQGRATRTATGRANIRGMTTRNQTGVAAIAAGAARRLQTGRARIRLTASTAISLINSYVTYDNLLQSDSLDDAFKRTMEPAAWDKWSVEFNKWMNETAPVTAADVAATLRARCITSWMILFESLSDAWRRTEPPQAFEKLLDELLILIGEFP